MAIIQISKIQQRSGNLVDLPQLDEAEFGFASDDKRLFIGKESPNENIEVLTSYSEISYSQLIGAVGNLNISALTVADGQVLTYDGNNWVNRGGNAGGLITLGNVSNVKIDGGAIGYVLETDGTGNLSWTPKSTILSYILNVTQANPAVVTTTEDNFFTDGSEITITGAIGMTQLNGNSYYANVITSNTFSLYSNPGLTSPINSTGYGQYAYANVTGSTSSTNTILLDDETPFTANDPVVFVGNTGNSGIISNVTYYIDTVVGGTGITVSETLGGNIFAVATDTFACEVYVSGGRALSSVSGGGVATAAGTTYSVQYNNYTLMGGGSDFTWNFDASPKVLTVNGNANVGNLNSTTAITASYFISNVSTGTAPITVTSTTRVANLNVSYSNVSDYSNVLNTTTNSTFYPIFVNSSTNGNKQLRAASSFSMNPSTGDFTVIGNITGNYFIGNGAGLTNVASNIILNDQSNVSIASANSNITMAVAGTSNVIVISTAGANITGTLNASGNANVGNLGTGGLIIANGNITGGNLLTTGQITSTLTTGTAPLLVASTTRVANLNVSYANVSDYGAVTSQSTGIYYLTFVTGSSTANYALASNSAIYANLATGTISATTFVGNIVGNISGTITAPGSNSQVIFNDAGNVNATSGLTFNKSTNQLSVSGNANVGNLGATNGVFTSVSGTLTTASQPNITSVGTLGNLLVTGNVTSGNLIANGLIQTTNITTGANVTAGSITGNWSLTTGSRLTATYADLAEYYSADKFYAPGTVLEFGGDHEVTLATSETNRVAGIVSSEPAYVMNGQCPGDHPIALALQGRVMCYVKGPVKKGDMLISAGDGYAKTSSQPQIGTVIGKSLENLSAGQGMIEVAVGR